MTTAYETRTPGIVWRDPPPRRSGSRGIYAPLLATVMTRPGAWALIRTVATGKSAWSIATQLRRRHPGFEFRAVGTPDGGDIYARYVNGSA